MRRASFTDMQCSVAQSLEQIGEWWSLLIIRDALLGVRRFEDFRTRLGIASNILTSRLDTLVAHGILELDNNTAERGMRAIALGRKNYLFVGSQTGGKAAAIFTSAMRKLSSKTRP